MFGVVLQTRVGRGCVPARFRRRESAADALHQKRFFPEPLEDLIKMIRFSAYAVVLAGAAFISGCGGPDPADCAPGQYWDANMEACVSQNGGQCPMGQTWNGSMCVQGGAMQCPAGQAWNGSACVATGTPQCPAGQSWNGSQCVPAGGPAPQAGSCQVSNMGGAGGPVADQAIAAMASQYIPAGSRAVGSAYVGNFQAGQCMEIPINVDAGKCYTIVGASVGAVSDLDIELVPNLPIPGLPQTAVAQDQGDGPTAVLGGKPNCWTAMIPGPMKMIVRVQGGQGIAGAQIYAK
jgi:hypothetical protein